MLPWGDPMAGADFARDERRNASACPNCGSPEPVRLGDGGCSDCIGFPSCWKCGGWVGDGAGWLPGHRRVVIDGEEALICDRCWEEVP